MRSTLPSKSFEVWPEFQPSESLVPSPVVIKNMPSSPKAMSPPSWPFDFHSITGCSDLGLMAQRLPLDGEAADPVHSFSQVSGPLLKT